MILVLGDQLFVIRKEVLLKPCFQEDINYKKRMIKYS